MTATPKHSVSVAGIVLRDDGRVLAVQRRDNRRWEPPGGVLELGETFEDGVRREVREETGIDVEVDCLTGVYKNMRQEVVALVFRCRPLGTELRETGEAARVDWLTVEDVVRKMAAAYSVRVTDALADRPPARVHDGTDILPA